MKLLRFLESVRTPFFNALFSLITHIGEETVFLVIAITVFWCVSKRKGYYILITGLVGTVVNQFLKLIFKIPRPWKDPTFSAVESAKAEAGGYSFPSGHTQNVTGTFGAIARDTRRKAVHTVAVAVIVAVAFSRMYLGVHTPLDVGFSLVFGAFLVFALYPVFSDEARFERLMPCVVTLSSLLSLSLFVYVFAFPDASADAENLASAMKNSSTLLGCTVGLAPVYFIDKYFVKFDTGARWYAQIIKLTVGLALILLIKWGLAFPLSAIFRSEYAARAVRYFIVVMFAGVLWPLTFRRFSEMRIPALDKFGKKKA